MTKCKTPDKCRITRGTMISTTRFGPVYVGPGENLNPIPITSTSFTRSCSTCGRRETVSIQGGEETVTVHNPGDQAA